MDKAEYEKRFKAYIVSTLTAQETHPNADGYWTWNEAVAAADNEFESMDAAGITEDPEGDARESMSYWDADE